ncbi:MAG: VCBS repeat-containing protein, partial [Desulfuromonadales bacterium]|nr:VCBS repeat-containing protein [Desulfuromonadales bacterium]
MSRLYFPLALVLSFFFSLPHPAMAGPVEEVAGAFRPAAGVVIMQAGDEYLIDLDAAKGLREGDLLTVTVPGEKIVHPVSGQVLGSLDTVKGVLQATRVKSGYSYVRPLGSVQGIGRGDVIRRWEQVPTAFQGEGEEADLLARDLQAALPHLDWRSNGGKEVLLTFVLGGGRLEARGPGGTLLASALIGSQQTPPSSAVGGPSPSLPSAALPPAIVAAPAPAAPATASAIVRREATATEGVWFGPDFAAEIVGIHVADLDGDGRQEVAIALPYRLEVGRVTAGSYTPLAALDLGFGQKVVSLDGADLDGDGRVELYLTAADEGELRSLQVGLQGEKLKLLASKLPWYMRSIQLPGEGAVLLGQRMGGGERDFDGPIFRLTLSQGKVAEGAPVDLPASISLFGFSPLPGDAGLRTYAQLNVYDELKVVGRDGQEIWKSEERVGGSESFIERLDPTKNPISGPATRNAFMPPRLLQGPEGTLLVPVNEGSRLLARIRTFDKSRLRAMTWNGFALQE